MASVRLSGLPPAVRLHCGMFKSFCIFGFTWVLAGPSDACGVYGNRMVWHICIQLALLAQRLIALRGMIFDITLCTDR